MLDARCSPLFDRRELEECVVLGSTSRTYEQVGWVLDLGGGGGGRSIDYMIDDVTRVACRCCVVYMQQVAQVEFAEVASQYCEEDGREARSSYAIAQ